MHRTGWKFRRTHTVLLSPGPHTPAFSSWRLPLGTIFCEHLRCSVLRKWVCKSVFLPVHAIAFCTQDTLLLTSLHISIENTSPFFFMAVWCSLGVTMGELVSPSWRTFLSFLPVLLPSSLPPALLSLWGGAQQMQQQFLVMSVLVLLHTCEFNWDQFLEVELLN